ncbi:MAG TPA: hypothetical protein DD429_00190 [Clostridiaceae bacterium]|nr:hypothetical protein [Clostridiaceae bacterium]
MADTRLKETEYKEFGKCVEISNGTVSLLVTVESGPRIIRYGFVGKDNMFCEKSRDSKPSLGGDFKIRGGHRLWHSPEQMPRTYIPDNNPVQWHTIENGISVTQETEKWTQIKKEMEISLNPSKNRVKIVHKLTNKNAWPVEYAVWALSMMAPGGLQVIPQPRRDTGLLPNRMISLWPYSKMNDERVCWGEKYILFKQIPGMAPPFKLGLPNEDGWVAYFNYGSLFIKRFSFIESAKYLDYGSSYETYTDDCMMEMESLSPLNEVMPDATISHVEEWDLIDGVDKPRDESEIEAIVKKYIKVK